MISNPIAPIVFQFQSQEVRVISSDMNHPEFVAVDVAKALGFKDAVNAIKLHCRGVAKYHPIADTLGRMQNVRVIQEPDLYRLIFGSTLDSAQKFQDWVFEEVLPQIRQTGRYDGAHSFVPMPQKNSPLDSKRAVAMSVIQLIRQMITERIDSAPRHERITHLLLDNTQEHENALLFFSNYVLLRACFDIDLNHSANPKRLAINLIQYFQLCYQHHLPTFNGECYSLIDTEGLYHLRELRKQLHNNIVFPYCQTKNVKSALRPNAFSGNHHAVHCDIFHCDVNDLLRCLAPVWQAYDDILGGKNNPCRSLITFS